MVEAERAELAVAEEVGDPPRPAVAGGVMGGEDGMLGQVPLEQLDPAGEGADVGGLDEPGQQPGAAADVVVGARVDGDEPGDHADHAGGIVQAAGAAGRRVELSEPVAELVRHAAGPGHYATSGSRYQLSKITDTEMHVHGRTVDC